MLPLRVRGDLRAMAIKRYSAFPKAQHCWNLAIKLFSVIQDTRWRGVLPFCREAVGVFYSCNIVDSTVPANHKVKIKEKEKRDKYLDIVRGLNKLWNLKVTVIPVVIGTLETNSKGYAKCVEVLDIGGRAETIQTTALLKSARILRRVLVTWGNLLSFTLQ